MEPEIVTNHEHNASEEGEVVSHHGWEDVPGGQAGGGREEPDGDNGSVLDQTECVV